MFLVSWIWFSMPYLVIARMGLFNNEKHMINDTLWVECKWKGLQIKVLQRLGWPSLYSWHFAVGSLRTLIFICSCLSFDTKQDEKILNTNLTEIVYVHISLTLIFEIAGPMVKCLKHCWSLCWKARHFYSSSRTWPLEWSRYGENTVYSHSESSLRQGRGRGGSKVTMEVKSLT